MLLRASGQTDGDGVDVRAETESIRGKQIAWASARV